MAKAKKVCFKYYILYIHALDNFFRVHELLKLIVNDVYQLFWHQKIFIKEGLELFNIGAEFLSSLVGWGIPAPPSVVFKVRRGIPRIKQFHYN